MPIADALPRACQTHAVYVLIRKLMWELPQPVTLNDSGMLGKRLGESQVQSCHITRSHLPSSLILPYYYYTTMKDMSTLTCANMSASPR